MFALPCGAKRLPGNLSAFQFRAKNLPSVRVKDMGFRGRQIARLKRQAKYYLHYETEKSAALDKYTNVRNGFSSLPCQNGASTSSPCNDVILARWQIFQPGRPARCNWKREKSSPTMFLFSGSRWLCRMEGLEQCRLRKLSGKLILCISFFFLVRIVFGVFH